ncbi:MAG: DUF1385 domain-containing protein [Chloroflexi bacterium]|nr:DUF1385 domain-containing protein [Chloroflexota bacterium]
MKKQEKEFRYGGQAVIDGVMMRGKTTMATAIRRPGGDILVDSRFVERIYNGIWRNIFFVRGIFALIESLVLGIRSLYRSASVALEEEVKEVPKVAVVMVMIFSFAMAIGLFILVPFFITNLLKDIVSSSFWFHFTEGIIRLLIFILYIMLISLMKDIRNTFAYHGAEHAAIDAYEHKQFLDPAKIDPKKIAHARCGTSFVIMVLLIAIVVFSFVGFQQVWLMILARILLLPIIASLSYELLMFTATNARNPIVKVIMQPGLWFQKLTTRYPDEKQLEVAVAAIRRVLNVDKAGGDMALANISEKIATVSKQDGQDIDQVYDVIIKELLAAKEQGGMAAVYTVENKYITLGQLEQNSQAIAGAKVTVKKEASNEGD